MDHFDNPQETVVEDDRIYGRGLVNMKAAFPCYIEAMAAIRKAEVQLKGDVIIAGVVGEIEKAQIGRFQGKTYRGAGVGARYMMDHGVMADMCIIGEPTGLQLQIGNAGVVWARVRVDGKATRFVLAAAKVAQAIQNWEKEYQRKYKHRFMLPTVQIGAIEGGNPFKPGTRPTTDIFVIVKILPGTPPLAIKREIEGSARKYKNEKAIFSTYGLIFTFHGRLRDLQERVCRQGHGKGTQGRIRQTGSLRKADPLRYHQRRIAILPTAFPAYYRSRFRHSTG
jgi:acetylornithine deacetylase/succinyl-diaminopimelate desuccinylase-like protein